jgi:hypothetical protein
VLLLSMHIILGNIAQAPEGTEVLSTLRVIAALIVVPFSATSSA